MRTLHPSRRCLSEGVEWGCSRGKLQHQGPSGVSLAAQEVAVASFICCLQIRVAAIKLALSSRKGPSYDLI